MINSIRNALIIQYLHTTSIKSYEYFFPHTQTLSEFISGIVFGMLIKSNIKYS